MQNPGSLFSCGTQCKHHAGIKTTPVPAPTPTPIPVKPVIPEETPVPERTKAPAKKPPKKEVGTDISEPDAFILYIFQPFYLVK